MSELPVLSADELSILRGVDTPTICNVIELFDVRPRNLGYLDERISAAFPDLPPMVGYATTATFRSNAPPRHGDAYASLEKQLAEFAKVPSPPIVVFQDLDSPAVAATFGEVMCATYRAFGAAGLITSGAGRDLDQVRALGFPVFTGGTICSHGYCHILEVNVPVHVGGTAIYPGDLLHGDRNGVTTIPREISRQVVALVRDFLAAEEEVLSYVKAPNPTLEGFTAARQRMMQRIKTLSDQVRAQRG
jgi:regulator of RNase E activity RraA